MTAELLIPAALVLAVFLGLGLAACPCCGGAGGICCGRTFPDKLNVSIVVDSGDISCLGLSRFAWQITWDPVRLLWWSNEPISCLDCAFMQVVVKCGTVGGIDTMQMTVSFLATDTPPESADVCSSEIQDVNDANQPCPADPLLLDTLVESLHDAFECCFQGPPRLIFHVIVTE